VAGYSSALLACARGLSVSSVAELGSGAPRHGGATDLKPDVARGPSQLPQDNQTLGLLGEEAERIAVVADFQAERYQPMRARAHYEVVPAASLSSAMWPLAACIPLFLWIASSETAPIYVVIPAWVFGGILMNIVNKIAAVIFPESFLLVLMQMSFAIVFLLLTEFRKMTCKKWVDIAKWMIVPFLFSGILATSLLSFKKASLSTVMICRNVLPFITFSIEKAFLNTPATVGSDLILSMVTTLVGVALYSACQSQSAVDSPQGLAMVYANALLCAVDRLTQSRLLKSPDFECHLSLCLLLNNLVGMAPVLLLGYLTGETQGWGHAITKSQPITWLWVALSCCCGFCLGYLGLKTQRAVTATTSLMLQNVTKVLLIFIGVLWFGDRLGYCAGVGCSVAIAGGLWYGVLCLPAETSLKGLQEKGKQAEA